MDGFFSRFAWAWLDRRSPDLLTNSKSGSSSATSARKSWTRHAGHQRTLTPHRVSPMGHDEQIGPPSGP